MVATPASRISFLKVKNPQEIKYDTLRIFQLNTLGTTVNEIPMDPLTSARTDMRKRELFNRKVILTSCSAQTGDQQSTKLERKETNHARERRNEKPPSMTSRQRRLRVHTIGFDLRHLRWPAFADKLSGGTRYKIVAGFSLTLRHIDAATTPSQGGRRWLSFTALSSLVIV